MSGQIMIYAAVHYHVVIAMMHVTTAKCMVMHSFQLEHSMMPYRSIIIESDFYSFCCKSMHILPENFFYSTLLENQFNIF